jgi:hypothetical protein
MTSPAPLQLAGHVDETVWGYALAEALEHVGDCVFPTSVTTYAAMRRDPALAAILAAYTLPIRRATWAVDPTGCRPEVAQLVADDLGLPVVGDDSPGAARTRGVSWPEHLRAALGHLTFGFAGFELLAEIDDTGQARLVGLFERTQPTIQAIHADGQGRLLGVSQDLRGEGKPPQITADRLLWYSHDREGGAHQGTSVLRPAFGPWLIKKEMMRVHATANRRFGMGVPIARALPGTTPTPAQHAEAAKLAQAARVGDTGGGAMPPNYILELVGLTGSTPDTLTFLKWLDQQMSRMALAGFLDLGSSETGSRALGEAFIDLFTLSIQAIAEQAADTVTRQAAARIVDWNWGGDEPVPQVTVADVGTKHEVTADAIQQLMAAGAITPDPALEAYVRRSYRLPQRDQNTPPPLPKAPPQTQPVAASTRQRRARRESPDGQLELPLAAEAAVADPQQTEADAFQSDWVQTKADVLAEWPALAEPMVNDLAQQASENHDDLVALAALVVPPAIVAVIAATLSSAMLTLAASSAAHVVASAAAQGVGIDAPAEAGGERVGQVAQATAQLIATRYATAAATRAMQVAGPNADPQAVLDAVKTHLDELAASGSGMVADAVGSALSAAQAAGRQAVYVAHPPKRLIAVEINDSNECEPCKEISGTEYATVAESEIDYPIYGYRSCAGLTRCRGHAHAVWK